MITDREEIESVLQIGEKILLDYPELYNMSLDDVLVKLDDGTEQMLHNRWGVTAWLVVRSLECFDVKNSDCYCVYGLKRTGCAGCPFGQNFEEELRIMKEYEPKLFIAANNIFGASYQYTRMYKEYSKRKEEVKKGYEQMTLF